MLADCHSKKLQRCLKRESSTAIDPDLLHILTRHTPRLQASALRILRANALFETDLHPYAKQQYKLFEKAWSEMQQLLQLVLDKFGGIVEDADREEETNQDLKRILERERSALQSSFDAINDAVLMHWRNNDWMGSFRTLFQNERRIMDNCIRNLLDPDLPSEQDMIFCCPLKCLLLPDVHSGITCCKCRSSWKCYCHCVMYMAYMLDTTCCPLLCVHPSLGECLICTGACLCRCLTHQQLRLLDSSLPTVRVLGRLIQVVNYEGAEKYCCDDECFRIPERLIREITCGECEGVNYCKCDCKTWREKRNTKRYEWLVKPKEGWQAASEKDLREWRDDPFKEKMQRHYYSTRGE